MSDVPQCVPFNLSHYINNGHSIDDFDWFHWTVTTFLWNHGKLVPHIINVSSFGR